MKRARQPSTNVDTKQVYVPMEEWDIDEARKRHEAEWLREGWRRVHVVSVPGTSTYLVTLERNVGWLGGERR
jgi:hypothetical protein